MKQNKNDHNHTKESTPVVDNKPNGKSQFRGFEKGINQMRNFSFNTFESRFRVSRLLICVLCLVPWVSIAQQFEIDGKIYANLYNSTGISSGDYSCRFTLSVSNCSWQLHMAPTNAGAPDYSVLIYDGTQLYYFQNNKTAVEAQVRKSQIDGSPVPTEINYGEGVVVNSEVPHILGLDGAGIIWLSYASACTLSSDSTGQLELPLVWGVFDNKPVEMRDSIKRRALWNREQGFPKLPISVSYLSAMGDFTNGLYQASVFTNFQNMALPLASTFKVFFHEPHHTNIFLMFDYTINAENFRRLEDFQDVPPHVPVLTTVVDWRFGKRGHFQYNIANRFLTKDEAMKTPDYTASVLESTPRFEARGKGGRLFILATMIAITMIFGGIAIRNAKQKQ